MDQANLIAHLTLSPGTGIGYLTLESTTPTQTLSLSGDASVSIVKEKEEKKKAFEPKEFTTQRVHVQLSMGN